MKFIAFLILISSSALADQKGSLTHFSLLAGVNTTRDQIAVQNASTSSSYAQGHQFGMTYESPIFDGLGFELGAFYTKKKISVLTNDAIATETTLPYIEVPVLLRFWMLEERLSLGAGVYAAGSAGEVTQKISQGRTESTRTGSFEKFELKRGDFGAVLSLGAFLPFAESFGLVVDLRYSHSVTNISRSDIESDRLRTISALAGFQFRF